jgi:DNA-binding transcriptional ArsR family regulator
MFIFMPKMYLVMLVLPLPFSGFGKIIFAANPTKSGSSNYHDPRFRRVLWSLIAGTRGGPNRAKILNLINSYPANSNQIATELGLDYKTVLHHIRSLSQNGLIITDNKESYGALYFLSPLMENNLDTLKEILAKIGQK